MSANRTKLPDSITNPKLRALYEAALDELDLIRAEIYTALIYAVSDEHELPIKDVLPLLAKDLNVHGLEYYNATVSDGETGETHRRDVIANSFKLHKEKGTAGIIRKVAELTGRNDIDVQEWFEFGGAPFTFKVSAQLPLSQRDCDVVFGLIKEYKRFVCREINEYMTQKYAWMPVSGLTVGKYVDFPVQASSGSISLVSPVSGASVLCGDPITVSGTSDQADGTTVYIAITLPDSTVENLTTTLSGGLFSMTYTVPDNHGAGTVTVSARAVIWTDAVEITAVARSLEIISPVEEDSITVGNTTTISGTTNYADGTTVTLSLIQEGTETAIGTATVSGGAFSYSWIANGDPGDATVKAVAGVITATVDITLAQAFVVDEPEENDPVLPDVSFYAEVSGCSDGDVEVYYGGTLLTTLTASEGTASGNVTIPGRLLGGGYAYIVSGGTETRVGDTANLTVRFVNNGAEAVVNVVATLDGNQDLGPAEGTAKTAPDHTATGEIDYGEAEGSVVSQKADREQSNSINYGTAKVSEVRFDIVDWFLDEGTATGAVKNTTDESDTNNHDMGDAAGTVTITTGE